jgi:phage virion morphogenesis protein
MSTFTIQLQDDQVTGHLRRLSARLADLTPAMQDIGRKLGLITEDSFQNESSPWGVAWAPLDAAYVQRQRHGDANPILQVSGGLAGSVTHGGDAQSAWVGVSKIYGAIHQFGGLPDMAPGPAAIEARPYLPITAQGELAPVARDAILAVMAGYLD